LPCVAPYYVPGGVRVVSISPTRPQPAPPRARHGSSQEANDTAGEGTIEFDIGDTNSVKTISPASPLPTITDTATTDGYTQRGARENTLEEGTDAVLKIELDGTSAGDDANGLSIEAADSTIKALVINRFDNDGIAITGAGTTGNMAEGNFIGTNAAGTADRGNFSVGVSIRDQSDDSTIGGTQPAQRNLISGNGTGVRFSGDASFNEGTGLEIFLGNNVGNSILSNSIFANEQIGIDLNNNGVPGNDPDDPDTGANNLQNFPDINSANLNVPTGFTAISGILYSNPNQTFLIQCFLADDPADASGHGEGAILLDSTLRTTNSFGGASFQCDTQVPEEGQTVGATATNVSTGDTSEFSENEEIIAP